MKKNLFSIPLRYQCPLDTHLKKIGVVESNAKDADPKYFKKTVVVDLFYPATPSGFDLSDPKKGFCTLLRGRPHAKILGGYPHINNANAVYRVPAVGF